MPEQVEHEHRGEGGKVVGERKKGVEDFALRKHL
jgi:hypothetical protein